MPYAGRCDEMIMFFTESRKQTAGSPTLFIFQQLEYVLSSSKEKKKCYAYNVLLFINIIILLISLASHFRKVLRMRDTNWKLLCR